VGNFGVSAVLTTYFVVIVIIGMVYLLSTALFTGWLAGKKGYDSGLWGVLGFFFGFIALLTIGFAPENNNSNRISSVKKTIENPNAKWSCPECNESNLNTTYQCSKCGYKII
jgi:predicted RNA-binding Zn-ribbon protein involved in translation (DUF1610 family)